MKSVTRQIKYGSEKIDVSIPEHTDILEITNPESNVDKDKFIDDLALSVPQRKEGNLLIVLSDKTRLCGYEIYLDWVLTAAKRKGYARDNITFIIAYGTHPQQSDAESIAAYGDVFNQYSFIHHNCDSDENMLTLGTTDNGTDVRVRREVVESDAVILFGAISHHYFAGYGGGRKLIFPGLASRESIYNNHKLFIDFNKGILMPGCQSGHLPGNPVAEDLRQIDKYFPDKIIVSGILNKSGKVTRLLIGKSYDEFLEACELYDSFYRKKESRLYDVVISSSGGYPKDINFIQTHKSVHNAASFVKDGGSLILFGECRDGIGNDAFLPIFDNPREKAIEALGVHYSGNGGTALSMMEKAARISIYMVTSLDEIVCSKIGVTKLDPGGADKLISSLHGEFALIENASIIFR